MLNKREKKTCYMQGIVIGFEGYMCCKVTFIGY